MNKPITACACAYLSEPPNQETVDAIFEAGNFRAKPPHVSQTVLPQDEYVPQRKNPALWDNARNKC